MTFYTGAGRRGGYVPGRDPMVDEVMRGWQQRIDDFYSNNDLLFWKDSLRKDAYSALTIKIEDSTTVIP